MSNILLIRSLRGMPAERRLAVFANLATVTLLLLISSASAASIDIVCKAQSNGTANSGLPQQPTSAQIDLDNRVLKTEFGSFGIKEFDEKKIWIEDARVDGLARLSVSGSLDRLSGRLRLVWRNSLQSSETVGEFICSRATQQF